jgi:hypothetical protein
MPAKLMRYSDVLDALPKTCHLLIGNGFSVACDQIFSYPSLYDAAVTAGLSRRAQKVFSHVGTNNFEGTMRLLDDAHWVAETYGLIPQGGTSQMLSDVDIVKRTLVEAVANNHLERDMPGSCGSWSP